MSVFVLDTDILSLLQDYHPVLTPRVKAYEQTHQVVLTAISVEEQISGWYTFLRRARTRDKVAHAYVELVKTVQWLSTRGILMFTVPAILRYESLLVLNLNARKNDLRIAAIALEAGGTVVTRNLRDFQRVPGLSCADWSV